MRNLDALVCGIDAVAAQHFGQIIPSIGWACIHHL
jgi:hypothetical protein